MRRISSYGAAFFMESPNQVNTLLHYLLLTPPAFPDAGRISPRLYASGILNIRVTGHGYHGQNGAAGRVIKKAALSNLCAATSIPHS